jgi:hypothetical protein
VQNITDGVDDIRYIDPKVAGSAGTTGTKKKPKQKTYLKSTQQTPPNIPNDGADVDRAAAKSKDSEGQTGAIGAPTSPQDPPSIAAVLAGEEWERGIHQVFVGGDPCLVNGKEVPRSGSATFLCNAKLHRTQHSFRISEPKTCSYDFVIYTPLVCGLC